MMKKMSTFTIQTIVMVLLLLQRYSGNGEATAYEVVYAINAGGESHIDVHNIRYERDPLLVGIPSDFGKQLMMIGRVLHQPDEILYQTERYHTGTFGYDLPADRDGEYVLILKFCEVYFNAPNLKVFDVVLNAEHTVVPQLDIFQQVGRGVAHDEYIHFSIAGDQLYYKEEESEIRGGKIRVEFIKGNRDNPKINAIVLMKGDLRNIPKLPPLEMEMMESGQEQQQQHYQKVIEARAERPSSHSDFIERPSPESPPTTHTGVPPSGSRSRKPSGPKHEDPYALDESSIMLPVFIAIGAFIPLLFCMCKL